MGPPKCGAPGNCPICPSLKPALTTTTTTTTTTTYNTRPRGVNSDRMVWLNTRGNLNPRNPHDVTPPLLSDTYL